MHRYALHAQGLRTLAALALLLALPSAAAALPLLSEVFYDASGSDDGQSFVEIHGAPGADLTGLVVEGINGSNGAVTDSIALSGLVPDDGIFVLADDQGDGTTLVADADLLADFDFQTTPKKFRGLADELARDGDRRWHRWDASTGAAGSGTPIGSRTGSGGGSP